MTLALCSFDEVNQWIWGGESGFALGSSGMTGGSERGGTGIGTVPLWLLFSSDTLKNPKPCTPSTLKTLSVIQPHIFSQRMAKRLCYTGWLHWQSHLTSSYNITREKQALKWSKMWELQEGKKLSIPSTLSLTYCGTSSGKVSFHGNTQAISLHYISFLSVFEDCVSPWRLRVQHSVVAHLRNKDELHWVGFRKFGALL